MKDSMVFLSVVAVLMLAQGQWTYSHETELMGPLFQVGKVYATYPTGQHTTGLGARAWSGACFFEIMERDGTWARVRVPEGFPYESDRCGYEPITNRETTREFFQNGIGVWINTDHFENVLGPMNRTW